MNINIFNKNNNKFSKFEGTGLKNKNLRNSGIFLMKKKKSFITRYSKFS